MKSIPRVYTPQILLIDEIILLESAASSHLLRVLRLQVGDSVLVFNGQGGEYRGKICAIEQGQARVHLYKANIDNRESPLIINLVQGVSRGDRMDYVIQKATELGVSSITPVLTERCVVKLSGKRLKSRLEHWQKIITSSCQQSGRCRIPQLFQPFSLRYYLSQYRDEGKIGVICDIESKTSFKDCFLSHKIDRVDKVTLFIGPEGGFTHKEIENQCTPWYKISEIIQKLI